MAFILTLHGEVRWLVALFAVLAIVRFGLGLIRNSPYTGMDRGIIAAYTGLMDVNLLLGLVLLVGLGGGLPAARLEHAVTMILAVAVAHLNAIWRKSDDAQLKFRNNLIVVLASITLVIAGVIRLRGDWLFG